MSKSVTDPEQPAFSPLLAFIGATEGLAEGLWLVALLSLVDTEGNTDKSISRESNANSFTDQPLLYAFFDLAMAIAGDLGIAISLAAEGNLVRSKLMVQLSGYSNAEEVS